MTPSYKIVNGVAIPLNLGTLGAFQGLQRAVNTFKRTIGPFSPDEQITVDGELGQATLRAVGEVIYTINAAWNGPIDLLNSADRSKVRSRIDGPIATVDGIESLANRVRFYEDSIAMAAGVQADLTPAPSSRQQGLPPGPAPAPAPRSSKTVPVLMGIGGLVLLGWWLSK